MTSAWFGRISLSALVLVVACQSSDLTSSARHNSQCTQPTVTVSPALNVLAVGDTARLAADVIPMTNLCAEDTAAAALRWTTSDTLIASVDANGLVTAHRAGSVSLSIRAPTDSVLGSGTVDVYAPLFDRIIYSTVDSGNKGLWTVAPDGSDRRHLLGGQLTYPEHPMVSPDGRDVVFEDGAELHVVDAGGWRVKDLSTGQLANFEPSWSRDGQWILFEGDNSYPPVPALYLIHPDGTGLKMIPGSMGARFPAWGPGDTAVAFLVTLPADTTTHWFPVALVTMDVQGVHRDTLRVFSPGAGVWGPAWSPDGSAIDVMDGTPGVWSVGRLVLNSTYSIVANGQGNHPGNWSPNGQSFVYGTGDLWIMNATGASQHPILTDGAINMDPSWAPSAPTPTAHKR